MVPRRPATASGDGRRTVSGVHIRTSPDGKEKPGRATPTIVYGSSVDRHTPSHDRRIAVEPLAPPAIAQDHDGPMALVAFVGPKKRPSAGVSPSSANSDGVSRAPSSLDDSPAIVTVYCAFV